MSIHYEIFFFYLFSSLALTSAIFVIYSKNTVYSVFFLILVFVNVTGLLLVSQVEFLAIMLIIIYVGAITVLFLFVVMMLDIPRKDAMKDNFSYLPIIFLISFTFFIETFIIYSKTFPSYHFLVIKKIQKLTYYKLSMFWTRYPTSYENVLYFYNEFITKVDSIQNIEKIGQLLYTYYAFFILIAGLVLLIALIGAVMLTIKEKSRTKENYYQLSRNFMNAIYSIQKK